MQESGRDLLVSPETWNNGRALIAIACHIVARSGHGYAPPQLCVSLEKAIALTRKGHTDKLVIIPTPINTQLLIAGRPSQIASLGRPPIFSQRLAKHVASLSLLTRNGPSEMTNAESTIRTLVVSDRRLLVEPLVVCLDVHAGFEVSGLADPQVETFQRLPLAQYDVFILDVDLPQGRAFELADRVRRQSSRAKLIFIADIISDVSIKQALRLKAEGFLSKDEPIRVLAENVRRVAAGEVRLSTSVEERVVFDSGKRRHILRYDTPLTSLTNRQLEILQHLCGGDSVKALAKRLHLSPKSVDSHKYRIMKKLGVNNTVRLARYAIREGLIRP